MALKKVRKLTLSPITSGVSPTKEEQPQKEETKVTSIKKFTIESVKQMAEEYEEISKKIKLLTDTKTALAENIKKASNEIGVKDDKGSFYVDCEDYIVGRVAKKSVSLDEEKALSFIKREKKNLCSRVITTIEKINEQALKNEVIGGTITKEEFSALVSSKTSYAVLVKKKEEMPDVEVSSLSAASKKKR